jgi:hypothetical protein
LRRRAVNAAQQQRSSGRSGTHFCGEENSVRFADIDQAMAQALEKAPVGDKYAQVSYETLVRMRAS